MVAVSSSLNILYMKLRLFSQYHFYVSLLNFFCCFIACSVSQDSSALSQPDNTNVFIHVSLNTLGRVLLMWWE